jgi:eukaryotic-like serine/threonine-protein kinase
MSAVDLSPGVVFARDFKVVKPLRAGGMGAVYIVDQVSTGKQRALKIMAPELVDNPEIRERFVLEARAASKIESDHVVEIVTAGVDETTGAPYIVMELLRGEELADAVERIGALTPGDVAEVLEQIGHALQQAHEHGIVHRDLKPENIFLAKSKRRDVAYTAKVLDFGIAKLVSDSAQKKTGTQPLGSPLYMSPEQTDRKGQIGPPTDVWALGLIAFHLLTAKSFWREAEEGSLAGLLREICVDPLASASERFIEMGFDPTTIAPPGFDAWFAKCVNRDTTERFANAGEAVRAFSALVSGSVIERRLVPEIPAGTGVAGASGGLDLSAAVGSKPTPVLDLIGGATTGAVSNVTTGVPAPEHAEAPKRTGLYVAIAVLGGAALGGLWMVTRNNDKPPPTNANTSSSATPQSNAPTTSASVAAAPAGTCPTGMIFHAGGAMILGAKDGSDDAKPPHKVTLSPFCIDKTEVTARDYMACVESTGCEKPPQDIQYPNITPEAKARYKELCTTRDTARMDHPVNCVDWDMAVKYCAHRKAKLPTEAQWEYAARGRTQRDYPWGDTPPSPKTLNACGSECVAWLKEKGVPNATSMFGEADGHFGTAPVGSFPDGASAMGVLDLAGNVYEWTADWYGPYQAGETQDPTGPKEGTERVARGGAFNAADPNWAKPAYRWKSVPSTYNHAIGFRCASDPN